MHTLICWFRRDLRVHDQAALYHASRDATRVIPLFILDPTLVQAPHANRPRITFLLQSLRALDANLRRRGGYLLVRRGEPAAALLAVLRESGAEGVYVNRDYLAPAVRRDARVRRAVETSGFLYRDFQDIVLVEPDQLLTQDQRPYRVYTPYRRAWSSRIEPTPFPTPQRSLATPIITGEPIPTAEELGWNHSADGLPGGEDEGLRRLARFIDGPGAPIHDYATARNLPGERGTSGLSSYLRFGAVSPRTALAAARQVRGNDQADQGKGPTAWEGELAWRDFYFAWMHHFPEVATHAFDRRYDMLPYENSPELFAAWCEGQTGYPIVDAGMRQLNTEGWMHNRVRMITAGFLCKDLLIDWRWGEAYFWQKLIDADKPANLGGWQWSASVGTDAQPYFRVFNPVTQGRRHDPHGAYVRRYVPELAGLPDEYVHAPWTLPPMESARLGFVPGKTYPAPIVDHIVQRQRAIEMFTAARATRVPAE